MSIDYKERKLRFWCQKVLPLVYDESLSYYELLCKCFKHLSETETDVSALEAWLRELDAEAVKKIYSEYPLIAEKVGNTVTLRRREDAKAPVTTFTNEVASAGNPITVTKSTGATVGPLDPDVPDSPEGTAWTEATATIEIADATEDARGAMSANDKQKMNRLFNTRVEAGDNIVVSTVTAANNDKTYTVSVDPNFAPAMKEWTLTGDEWEWNAALNGKMGSCYISGSGTQQQAFVQYLTGDPSSVTFKERMVYDGSILLDQFGGPNDDGTGYCHGFVVRSWTNYPFSLATCPVSNPGDGEPYYTTSNEIRIKCQLAGTGVANRLFDIYIDGNKQAAGCNGYSNTHNTHGDYYFPSTGAGYIPAKYSVTTDANGYFDVTIPAGLSGTCYFTQTGVSYSATTNNTVIAIVANGNKEDLYGNVKIEKAKIAIKAQLNA